MNKAEATALVEKQAAWKADNGPFSGLEPSINGGQLARAHRILAGQEEPNKKFKAPDAAAVKAGDYREPVFQPPVIDDTPPVLPPNPLDGQGAAAPAEPEKPKKAKKAKKGK